VRAVLINRNQHAFCRLLSGSSSFHPVQQGPYRTVGGLLYCSCLLVRIAGIAATGRLWLVPAALAIGIVYVRRRHGEK